MNYKLTSLSEFWKLVHESNYPQLKQIACRLKSMSATTYLRESYWTLQWSREAQITFTIEQSGYWRIDENSFNKLCAGYQTFDQQYWLIVTVGKIYFKIMSCDRLSSISYKIYKPEILRCGCYAMLCNDVVL